MCKDPIVEVWSSGYLVDKINRSWRLLKYRGRGKKRVFGFGQHRVNAFSWPVGMEVK